MQPHPSYSRTFSAFFLPNSWTDLEEMSFGERLRVAYLGRIAQMHLKAYALVNRDEARDLDDFRSLTPTVEEIEKVSVWLMENQLVSSLTVAKFRNLVTE